VAELRSHCRRTKETLPNTSGAVNGCQHRRS
jgi:hypothetical protein